MGEMRWEGKMSCSVGDVNDVFQERCSRGLQIGWLDVRPVPVCAVVVYMDGWMDGRSEAEKEDKLFGGGRCFAITIFFSRFAQRIAGCLSNISPVVVVSTRKHT